MAYQQLVPVSHKLKVRVRVRLLVVVVVVFYIFYPDTAQWGAQCTSKVLQLGAEAKQAENEKG
jgi:hypothetical protein